MTSTVTVRYNPTPKAPALIESATVVCPLGVTYAEVRDAILKAGGPLLESATLVSVYAPSPDSRNMTFALVFRDHTETLRRADISVVMGRIRALWPGKQ